MKIFFSNGYKFCFLLIVLLSNCSPVYLYKDSVTSIYKSTYEIKEINISNQSLVTGWYLIGEKETEFSRTYFFNEANYFIEPEPMVSIYDIENMYRTSYLKDKSDKNIHIQIKSDSWDRWYSETNKSIGKKMGFVLNNSLIYVSLIGGGIPKGASRIYLSDLEESKILEIENSISSLNLD